MEATKQHTMHLVFTILFLLLFTGMHARTCSIRDIHSSHKEFEAHAQSETSIVHIRESKKSNKNLIASPICTFQIFLVYHFHGAHPAKMQKKKISLHEDFAYYLANGNSKDKKKQEFVAYPIYNQNLFGSSNLSS